MDDYNGYQKPNDLLKRMQKVFEERDAEYQKRNEEFHKRQLLLDSLESKISQQQEECEEKRSALEEKEAMLESQISSVSNREAKIKQREQELDEETAKIEKMKEDLILEQRLTLEDLKTKTMAADREFSTLQREKSMLKNGVNTDIDLSMYYHKDIVERDYILRSELGNYMLQEEHDKIVANLRGQLDNALREKIELFRKTIADTGGQQLPNKEDSNPEQLRENDGEGVIRQNDNASEQERLEEEVKDETKEELNADVLYRYLQKNAHGLSDIMIYHAKDGDQIKAQRGRISYRFVFDEPCYYDLSVARKENRKTKQAIDEMNHLEKYNGVKFQYEDGRVRATGYFTSETAPYGLMSYVEELTNDCFEV